MTQNEMEAFKNRLKNYLFHQDMVEKLTDEISNIHYEMVGVKGINYDYRVSSTNEEIKKDHQRKLMEKADVLAKERESHSNELYQLNKMLVQIKLDDRLLVMDKYVFKKTYEELSKKHSMVISAIKYRIDKAILEVDYI